MKNVHSLAWYRSKHSGYESPRAGTSQGIFFSNFVPTVIRAHFAVWKDWELRIHHDDRVRDYPYFKVLERLHDAEMIKLVPMGKAQTLCGSMLWRMLPCFHDDVGWVVCRDVDSLPMHRDRKMVEEAMSASAYVHAILDSESHCGPLMGGMTSYYGPEIRKQFKDIPWDKTEDMNRHGADQRVLNKHVFPRFMRKTFIHQRRQDILYPHAMMTRPVAPQETALDKVVRHVGAAYDKEGAMALLKEEPAEKTIQAIEQEVL